MRPTTPATSAARRHYIGRMNDGTGDRNTALYCLTPAPRTKWRGGSGPGPSSLGISMKDQPLVLRLIRDPPVGPRTYYSFSASTEAGLVPHPRRLRLNRPSSEPSHPFKCAWSHLLHQPRLTRYSNRGDGTAVKSPFYHPLLTVQGLPCPVDTRSALLRLNRVRRRPPRPPHHTRVTSEASAKQALARSATTPARPRHSTKSRTHKARHVSYSGGHTD